MNELSTNRQAFRPTTLGAEAGVFALPGFDPSVVVDLGRLFPQGEGSTFQNARTETGVQTDFLLRILRLCEPKTVLETGTHKGHFGYFLRLAAPGAHLETFGIDPGSQLAADYLNDRFGDYVRFELGDSKVTLKAYAPPAPVDFAWIDGGHDYATCLSDLGHCARLAVPHVCVDDWKTEDGVRRAVATFMEQSQYEFRALSEDSRGIAYLSLS